MRTGNDVLETKASGFPLAEPIIRGWNRIISIGITDGISDFDKKRTRLINGICTWAFSIYFVYIFLYANEQNLQIVYYESILGAIGYSIPVLLNYRHRYNWACHYFCIFNLLFYTEQSLAGGEAIGIVYEFVPSCATALLFFRSTRVVIFYFVANFVFFILLKYSFFHYDALFQYGDQARSFYYANHIIMFVLLFMIVYYFRAENIRQEKLLEKRNINLSEEKEKAEHTLTELKSTQAQLIQSEKMASLGELTAGIAHEIQNPLNFVNNFSEVSTELVGEMNAEIDKGNNEEAKLIAGDLKQNLEKINHHGRRAGDIVKGMLQHSRSSSGVKEPTDINGLADEYLRLAYHGLRAKDKSFNATMKTDFDPAIGKINVIPQDIGRVILNLITNAFYTITEKNASTSPAASTNPASTLAETKYVPTVTVSTKMAGDRVLISVKDNGNGIPQKVLDKIFQPFFTTKPTGQGTGLGLSLSYDIVKAHGGELRVETSEGEGSEFIVSLPIF